MGTERPFESAAELLPAAPANAARASIGAKFRKLKNWCLENRIDLVCIITWSKLCALVHLLAPEPLEMLENTYEK